MTQKRFGLGRLQFRHPASWLLVFCLGLGLVLPPSTAFADQPAFLSTGGHIKPVNPIPVANGGTNAVTAGAARTSLSAAQSGVASASGLASITVGGSSASTTATDSATTFTGYVFYPAPITAELITIVADTAAASGAQIVAAQPAYPRKFQVKITDAGNALTAGTYTLVCVGPGGDAVSEGPTDISGGGAGGTRTLTTANACSTVTSFTLAGVVNAASAAHVSVGVATALGLPIPSGAGSVSVYKSGVGAGSAAVLANETIGTVDATARAIVPNTVPNGTKDFGFWFKYTVTPIQAAHLHAAGTLSATDAGHTHTQN